MHTNIKILLTLLLTLFVYPVSAAEPIGVVTLAIGVTSHAVGQAVMAGDRLSTGEGGQMHIHFEDDARVILRAETQVLIDHYEYHADNPSLNRVKYQLEKGTLRSVTGQAGQQNKSGFRLNTPLAAIGVRGTDFITQVLENHVKVAVVSGGVSVAPFGEHCLQKDFGPCETVDRLEAKANATVNAIEVKQTGNQIQIQPSDWLPEAVKAISKVQNIGVEGYATVSTQQATAEQQASNAVGGSVVAYNPIYWGRWSGLTVNDSNAVTAASLIQANYRPIAANSSFGLFASPEVQMGDLPRAGSIQLHPEQAQVYYRYANQLTPGVFDDGVLGLDFTNRTFATHIYVKPNETALVDYLYARGDLFNNGGFISNQQQSNAQVSGMLTRQANEAGMLFEQVKADKLITGGIWWKP